MSNIEAVNQRLYFSELLLLLLMISLPFTRHLLGLNLLFFIIAFGVLAYLNRGLQGLPTSLLCFSALSILYAFFSSLNLFPIAWTRYFDAGAIPQQVLYALVLPTSFLIMAFYFKGQLVYCGARLRLANGMLALWLFIKILEVMVTGKLGINQMISVNGLGNYSALVIAATCLYLTLIKSQGVRYSVIAIFVFLSFLSPFSQNKVYAIVFAVLWVFPRYAIHILIAFIVSSVLFYVVTISSPYSVRFIDTNLTVRLVLIRDALEGILQSYFIGVGFGTESIKNEYDLFDDPTFADEDDRGFIHLAVHNSFATVPFRVGAFGAGALLLFLVQTFSKIKIGSVNDVSMKCSLFAAFFIVTFQNPALESYIYLYAVCIYLSFIWAFDVQLNTK